MFGNLLLIGLWVLGLSGLATVFVMRSLKPSIDCDGLISASIFIVSLYCLIVTSLVILFVLGG